VTEPR